MCWCVYVLERRALKQQSRWKNQNVIEFNVRFWVDISETENRGFWVRLGSITPFCSSLEPKRQFQSGFKAFCQKENVDFQKQNPVQSNLDSNIACKIFTKLHKSEGCYCPLWICIAKCGSFPDWRLLKIGELEVESYWSFSYVQRRLLNKHFPVMSKKWLLSVGAEVFILSEAHWFFCLFLVVCGGFDIFL